MEKRPVRRTLKACCNGLYRCWTRRLWEQEILWIYSPAWGFLKKFTDTGCSLSGPGCCCKSMGIKQSNDFDEWWRCGCCWNEICFSPDIGENLCKKSKGMIINGTYDLFNKTRWTREKKIRCAVWLSQRVLSLITISNEAAHEERPL